MGTYKGKFILRLKVKESECGCHASAGTLIGFFYLWEKQRGRLVSLIGENLNSTLTSYNINTEQWEAREAGSHDRAVLSGWKLNLQIRATTGWKGKDNNEKALWIHDTITGLSGSVSLPNRTPNSSEILGITYRLPAAKSCEKQTSVWV